MAESGGGSGGGGWGTAAGILGILGTLYSVYDSWAQQEAARKARKRQKKQDAWDQFMAAAGGYSPGSSSPEQPLPQVPVGQAMQGLGSSFASIQQGQDQSAQQNWLKEYRTKQLNEQVRHNQAVEENGMLSASRSSTGSLPSSWGSGPKPMSEERAALRDALKRAGTDMTGVDEDRDPLSSIKQQIYFIEAAEKRGIPVDQEVKAGLWKQLLGSDDPGSLESIIEDLKKKKLSI